MATRQENALKTRQKLLDTTNKLIKEKGFYNLSVCDITQRANVATGTFYTYFKHKEEIVLEICKNLFKETQLKLEKNKNSDITKRLCLYFECFIKEVQGYKLHIVREWIKGLVEKNQNNESMGKIKWHYDFEMLKNILSQAVENKELKPDTPINTLCEMILAQMYGMFTIWCMSDDEFNPEKMIKEFSDIQLIPIINNYKEKI
ncbi:MAG: TetR/AcrR family transcriptional regulator [Candidatus Gastranaerophilales bacterium]|nr:TetR/AcrR family transcriptional regulator [Candidatus Gastranaerophilales bacterium]